MGPLSGGIPAPLVALSEETFSQFGRPALEHPQLIDLVEIYETKHELILVTE